MKLEEAREIGRQLRERYYDHPEVFAQEVFGWRDRQTKTWKPLRLWYRQVDICRLFASMAATAEGRTFPGMVHTGKRRRIAVKSGHKTGKTKIIGVLALWWFCTRVEAMVVLSSSSSNQVKLQVWKEITWLYRHARIPVGGEPGKDPVTGITLEDGRLLVGLSTNETERMAGYSGPQLLYLLDECSGIEDPIIAAVQGNQAGGAIVGMFSNPTKTSGKFFDAFHEASDFCCCETLSSEDAARVTPRIPGLTDPVWLEQLAEEYGVESAMYQIRAKGEFPMQGTDAVIPLSFVTGAIERWRARAKSGERVIGRLELGVDPARFGADESVIFPRRGHYAYPPRAFHGLDEAALSRKVLEVARDLRLPGEVPIVRVDAIGVGQGVCSILRVDEECVRELEVIPVYVTDDPTDDRFLRLRDQLWWGVRSWLKEGGEIPKDNRLEKELRTPSYKIDPQGRIKVASKDEMKPLLDGRSPDRADALALAIYRGHDSYALEIMNDRTKFPPSRFAESTIPGPRLAELAPDYEDDDTDRYR